MSERVSLSGDAYIEYEAPNTAGLLLQGIYLRRPTQQAYYAKHGFLQYVPLDTALCKVATSEPLEFHSPSPTTSALDAIQELEASGQLEEGSAAAAVESIRSMSFEDSKWVTFMPPEQADL